MLSTVKTMALMGLNGYLVDVQTDVTGGLPAFEIVGLPDTSVKESKERIRSAIKNSKIEYPSRRFLINLAPADTKKEGSSFDLAIAVGILIATGKIHIKNEIEKTIFIGELSLDGKINKVNGILPICIEARRLGIDKVIIPKNNEKEAMSVKGLKVIPVNHIIEVVKYLNKEIKINSQEIDIEKTFFKKSNYEFDFSEVKGQEDVKRALEIAAARYA